jgi:hypothetical protein
MWVEPQATALASTWGEHRRVCDLSVTLPALTQERMTLRMLVIEGSPSEDQRHIGDDRVAYGLLPAALQNPRNGSGTVAKAIKCGTPTQASARPWTPWAVRQ